MDTEKLQAAYEMYIARQARQSHPTGKFDGAGRWYPTESETCSCCKGIRTPSRSWPFSYMVHCRTAEHIAHLHGVDPKALRAYARSQAH